MAPRFHSKKRIQSVITDPPFGVDNISNSSRTEAGKKYATKIANDESPEVAMALFREVMEATIPGMKDESDIYIFTSHQVLEEWLVFTRELLEPHGFERKAILVWAKQGPGMGDTATWGMGCEFILYFKRGRRTMTDKRRNNVISIPQLRPDQLIHPHEKPLPLLELLIKHSTSEGDFIFDPFAGSGSLVRAARNLNRSAIGVEFDPDRAAAAQQKLNEFSVGFSFD